MYAVLHAGSRARRTRTRGLNDGLGKQFEEKCSPSDQTRKPSLDDRGRRGSSAGLKGESPHGSSMENGSPGRWCGPRRLGVARANFAQKAASVRPGDISRCSLPWLALSLVAPWAVMMGTVSQRRHRPHSRGGDPEAGSDGSGRSRPRDRRSRCATGAAPVTSVMTLRGPCAIVKALWAGPVGERFTTCRGVRKSGSRRSSAATARRLSGGRRRKPTVHIFGGRFSFEDRDRRPSTTGGGRSVEVLHSPKAGRTTVGGCRPGAAR